MLKRLEGSNPFLSASIWQQIAFHNNLVSFDEPGSGPLVRGDMHDGAASAEAMRAHRSVGVVRCVASIEIAASTENPLAFHWNNVGGTLSLLRAMRATGPNRLVFSSSCSVYGELLRVPIREDHSCNPIHPYGRSKWMIERVLDDLARHDGLRFVTLRYANAAGADPKGRIGRAHDPETHVVPIALEAASEEPFASTAPTTTRQTAPACAITCTWPIWRTRMCGRCATCLVIVNRSRSMSARAGAPAWGPFSSIATLLKAVERVTGRTVPREIAPGREGGCRHTRRRRRPHSRVAGLGAPA